MMPAPKHAVTVLCLAASLLTGLLAGCDQSPSRPKRSQTVALLPDTPPPPPPPPKPEDKKPEPEPEAKPQQQIEQPKPVEAPQPQALKSDEAAGDGPGSGLTAGSVTQDYKGGVIGGGAGPEVGVNRLALQSYANNATRALNEFLQRDRDIKRLDYRVRVNLWLRADGGLQRAELDGSTGDEAADAALRAALARFPGVDQPLPERLPMPIRLRVSNRMMG